jgi:hypothetical protein
MNYNERISRYDHLVSLCKGMAAKQATMARFLESDSNLRHLLQ